MDPATNVLPPGEVRRDESLPATVHLSGRQRDVLRLLGEGLSNRDIGTRLGVSACTVKSHVRSIFIALGAENRLQAVLRAQRAGLLPAA